MTGRKNKVDALLARIGEAAITSGGVLAGQVPGLGGLELIAGGQSEEFTKIMQQVIDENRVCKLKVHRKPSFGRPTFLGTIEDVPPKDLTDVGVEEVVRRVYGGGEFTVDIFASGITKPVAKGLVFHIAGVPNLIPGEAPPAQSPGPTQPQGQIGQLPNTAANITPWTQVVGQNGVSWKQVKGGDDLTETLRQAILYKTVMGNQTEAPQQNEQVKLLEAQIAELKEQSRRTEEALREERRQSEMRLFMESSNRKFEELAKTIAESNKPKGADWKEIAVAVASAAGPVVTALLGKQDAMANVLGTVIQSQNANSATQAEMFKAILGRPGIEERMGTMIGNISELMSSQFGTVSQIIQSGLLDKGGESPGVMLLSQALEAGKEIAMNVFTGVKDAQAAAMEQDQDLAGLVQPTAPEEAQEEVEVVEAQEDKLLEAHDEPEGVEESQDVEAPEHEPAQEEPQGEDQYDISKDPAFLTIFDRIEHGGPLQEIAMRIWLHAGANKPDQGHPLAKQWWADPAVMTKTILEQVGVKPERIAEVAQAIQGAKVYGREHDLNEHAMRVIPGRKKRIEKEVRRITDLSQLSNPVPVPAK